MNKQSVVSAAMMLALGSLGFVAALNWQPLTLLVDTLLRWPNLDRVVSDGAHALRSRQLRDDSLLPSVEDWFGARREMGTFSRCCASFAFASPTSVWASGRAARWASRWPSRCR